MRAEHPRMRGIPQVSGFSELFEEPFAAFQRNGDIRRPVENDSGRETLRNVTRWGGGAMRCLVASSRQQDVSRSVRPGTNLGCRVICSTCCELGAGPGSPVLAFEFRTVRGAGRSEERRVG